MLSPEVNICTHADQRLQSTSVSKELGLWQPDVAG